MGGNPALWWRSAVIYQIYPRSFADSNGDGAGDLRGIISRLDHVAALGVNAIWLSPVYPSPNRDFGYDVSDYCAIHPEFGTMADFGALLAEVHARGMKLILDQVLSHTSDEHPWFQDSVLGGGKRDWYVWADAKEDGTAPNNWLSAFGGPAWSYHPARRQYFHHKFLRQQPKLNLHHPQARAATLDVLRFWLDKGVDGFRLDVANSYLHDPALAGNPPVPRESRTNYHWAHAPRLQRHCHDANRPENAEMLRDIRKLMDAYPGSFAFGEFSEAPEMIGAYAAGPEALHSGYTFDFIEDESFRPEGFSAYYGMLARTAGLWPCVTFSNHDSVRTVTRFGRRPAGAGADPELAKLCLSLLLCLRGTVLLYQGEELGLEQADITDRTQIRDPVGDLYFPYFKGRDGSRTPMPWHAEAPHAGFSAGRPWLPVPASHARQAADRQDRDPQSVLNFARDAIAARRGNPALLHGEIVFLDAPGPVLAFERRHEQQCLLCMFNLGREPVTLPAQFQAFASGASETEPVAALCTERPGPANWDALSGLAARVIRVRSGSRE
jgi:alpha-glucosidase